MKVFAFFYYFSTELIVTNKQTDRFETGEKTGKEKQGK